MKNDGHKPAIYLRTVRDIAAALRLPLRKTKLAEVRHWTEREDFPRRDAKGWPKSAVLQWMAAFALERDTLLALNSPLKGKRLNAAARANLESIAAGGNGDVPARTTNKSQLARILSETFHEDIPRQYIDKFKDYSDFPRADDAGRFVVADVIHWYRHRRNGSDPGQPDLFKAAGDARNELDLIQRDKARMELQVLQKSYLPLSQHQQILANLSRTFWPRVRRAIEHELPEALELLLGSSEEKSRRDILNAFRHEAIQAIDRMETEFAEKVAP